MPYNPFAPPDSLADLLEEDEEDGVLEAQIREADELLDEMLVVAEGQGLSSDAVFRAMAHRLGVMCEHSISPDAAEELVLEHLAEGRALPIDGRLLEMTLHGIWIPTTPHEA